MEDIVDRTETRTVVVQFIITCAHWVESDGKEVRYAQLWEIYKSNNTGGQ